MMRAQKSWRSNFTQDLFTEYVAVPSKVYKDLISSEAVGKYFSDKVRNRFRTKQMVG